MSSQTLVAVTNNDDIYKYATTEQADSTDSTESSIPIYFLLYATLMISSIIGAKLLHDRPQLTAVLPEAGMIILIGIVAGMIIQLTFTTTTQHAIAKSLFTFSSDVFFVGLLPPIICTYIHMPVYMVTNTNTYWLVISRTINFVS